MSFGQILHVILYGAVEGLTEWFPVSSEGHMLLLDRWLPSDFSADFAGLLQAFLRFGAALAVLVVCFHRLNPFSPSKTPKARYMTWGIWGRILISAVPTVALWFVFRDSIDLYLHKNYVIALTLVLSGFAFLVLDAVNRRRSRHISGFADLGLGRVFAMGLVMALSLIPGTSWTGAAVLAALLLGCSGLLTAEYALYMAVPFLLGGGVLRLVRTGLPVSGGELAVLFAGALTAFAVSVLAVRLFLGFIRKHEYSWFGHYRIYLGVFILLSFYFL